MQTITIAPPKRSWFSLLSWAVVLAVLVVSWLGADMAPLPLNTVRGKNATFAAQFVPAGLSQWKEAIRVFQFQQTCALMVLIIVTVSLLDFLSQRLRKHFI
ncbi:hypothetical protein FQT78_21840 [Escherichia coli]|nr:hypothetical protein [Escherichia coli]QGJ58519.1 hypothetical protein FQT78_21840 [Escherichia coli]